MGSFARPLITELLLAKAGSDVLNTVQHKNALLCFKNLRCIAHKKLAKILRKKG